MKPAVLLSPICAGLVVCAALAADTNPGRVLPAGQKSTDARLVRLHDLYDKDFYFTPPPTRAIWEKRRKELREQVLVANGLWPLPEKTPLNPVIHGKIEKDDYTIEKVFFASYPGHYVSGNLYRPKNKTGKLPGVLFPHGHWEDARFFDAGEPAAKKLVAGGGEKTMAGARHPLQALPAELARMGCVVFHYDMVGHSDSKVIKHREGFTDADAELHLQSFMGLQTWNSIRALDFLTALPDVDAKRIGVTGASGGGTQTFILCAVDDRPTVAFPAVMVSVEMQGGCVCENCSLQRVNTGNVELAGLFAPKPLGMSGANDWTLHIEEKGLPELKKLYKLYDAEDKVMAKCFPQFDHNYNQMSREVMYNWFNKHLKLGLTEPVVEKPFEPVPAKELSVYDEQHPRPKDFVDVERLRTYLTEASDQQINALVPKDAKNLENYRHVVGTALRVMVNDTLPDAKDVEATEVGDKEEHDGVTMRRYLLARKSAKEKEAVPAIGIKGPEFDGTVVVWVHPEGKASLFKDGKLTPEAKKVLDRKAAILAVDVFGVGELQAEKPLPVDKKYAGFTFGYNRSLLANRVHDILTAVAMARGHEKTKVVDLVGFDKAGPWVLLARSLCGDAVRRTAADMNEFRFDKVRSTDDEMMLPGALKYGGLPALAGLAAPGELYVHAHRGTGASKWLKTAYTAAKAADHLQQQPDKQPTDKVIDWLLR